MDKITLHDVRSVNKTRINLTTEIYVIRKNNGDDIELFLDYKKG